MAERAETPVYRGMRKHVDAEGGYAIWLASDWVRYALDGDEEGMLFAPEGAEPTTFFSAQKHTLPYAVRQRDVPTLRRGFRDGLEALPGVEVEWEDETITSTIIALEARFTFLEGDQRRKRWVRLVYWGEGQLILTAQGASPEQFDYWLPMFFNTMTTVEL